MKPPVEETVRMTRGQQLGYGIGGFTLSLVTVMVTAALLQLFLYAVWTPPQSFLVACAAPLVISITALAASWTCLLKCLRNKAIIRGIWCQIYAVVGAAIVGLLVLLFL